MENENEKEPQEIDMLKAMNDKIDALIAKSVKKESEDSKEDKKEDKKEEAKKAEDSKKPDEIAELKEKMAKLEDELNGYKKKAEEQKLPKSPVGETGQDAKAPAAPDKENFMEKMAEMMKTQMDKKFAEMEKSLNIVKSETPRTMAKASTLSDEQKLYQKAVSVALMKTDFSALDVERTMADLRNSEIQKALETMPN